MKCPTHKTAMHQTSTRYGLLWKCPVNGCTVRCWDGPTSTPGDDETRAARHACHQAFDPLWKTKSHFQKRRDAYGWLMKVMKVRDTEAHIGMFSKEQCAELLEKIKQL